MVGSQIRKRRTELNMTQSDLASLLGIQRSVISKYENDLIDLSTSQIVKIATALQTTPSYLMGWEDSPAKPQESIEDEFVGFYGELKDKLTEEDLDDIKTLMRIRAELRNKDQ